MPAGRDERRTEGKDKDGVVNRNEEQITAVLHGR